MRWSQATASAYQSPPCARVGHVALSVDAKAAWGEELLLVHGGLGEDKFALSDLVVLQATSEAWFHPDTTSEVQPPARAFHCGAAVENKAYVFGGHAYSREKRGLLKFNDTWCLNTDVWEWIPLQLPPDSPCPSARSFACLAPLPNNQLLLFGGLDAAERRLDDSWVLDLTTSTWLELKTTGPKPKARYGHAMTSIDGKVVLFGGQSNTGLLNDLWTLRGMSGDSDESAMWMQLDLPGNSPVPRKGHAFASVGRWALVMGGHTAEVSWFRAKTDTFHNDVAIIDRSGGQVRWRDDVIASPAPETQLPPPRELHSLTAFSNGRLLLFGGGNGKIIFGDAWWLDLEGEPFAPTNEDDASQTPVSESWGQYNRQQSLPGGVESRQALSHQGGLSIATPQSNYSASVFSVDDREDAGSAAWWTGAEKAAALQEVRRRMKLPPHAQQQPVGDSSLPASPADLQHLLSTPVQELRMRDISTLLQAHHKEAHGSLKHTSSGGEHAASVAAVLRGLQTHRFAHARAADVRLGDVDALIQEYRSLAAVS
ncbi:hypothetical protein WJX73_001345 [Symbiochloris irregularis]|uniref:Uncharacterized protein n=1 Tax=Symbiochloris irregularis TaxID=706552 RepID=A0AAW1PV46_9CHLO